MTQGIPIRELDRLAYEVLDAIFLHCVVLCCELLGFCGERLSCRRKLVLDGSELRWPFGNEALLLLGQ